MMSGSESERVKEIESVETEVRRYVDVLSELLTGKAGKESEEVSAPRGTEKMPREELKQCRGLLFTTVYKGGIGLGVQHGTGFLITKKPLKATEPVSRGGALPSRQYTWSAPMFMHVNAGSIGATLGFSKIESVTILDTAEAVNSFCNTVMQIESDLTGTIGHGLGSHQPATLANVTERNLTDKEFSYSVASGMMVDVSLVGLRLTVDSRRNGILYGNLISPQAILEEEVSPPTEVMNELYEFLNEAINQ